MFPTVKHLHYPKEIRKFIQGKGAFHLVVYHYNFEESQGVRKEVCERD